MTEHRNLKRAVRARMRMTGENYTAALSRVAPTTSVETSLKPTTGVPMLESAIQNQPAGRSRWTAKALKIAAMHAPNIATELGQKSVGTEHLLAGFWGEPSSVAVEVLETAGLTRDAVVAAIGTGAPRGAVSESSWPSETLAEVDNVCTGIAIGLGHNYVGTEHLLLFLICDQGSTAEELLSARGLTPASVRRDVLAVLAVRFGPATEPI